jgi:beta-lactamase class A
MPATHRLLTAAFFCIVCFCAGLTTSWFFQVKSQPATQLSGTPLRIEGYSLISPLLVCDSKLNETTQSLRPLQRQLEQIIDDGRKDGSITTAAVYFRDLSSGAEVGINTNERFFPASLKKIPVMIGHFKKGERNSESLLARKTFTDTTDHNANVAIKPAEAPRAGEVYSNFELIEMMIKHSDNNSYHTLLRELSEQSYSKIYRDMQVHYPDSNLAIDDYITPFQLSLFFRTLYNATYLTPEYSEIALRIMTEATYRKGLAAGLPESVIAAHKFGAAEVKEATTLPHGELHDCGIIYHEKNPYILCVMTKSQSLDISKVETIIAKLSAATFKHVDSDYHR